MIVPPWLILALLTSLAFALLYQLLSGRYGRRLVAEWLLIFLGFLGAEMLSEALGWNFARVGDLRVLPDLTGALLVMAALWLAGI